MDRGVTRRRAWTRLQPIASAGRLPQPVLDRGPALAQPALPRRFRPADLYQLGYEYCRREAFELAGFYERALYDGHAEGDPCDRGGAGLGSRLSVCGFRDLAPTMLDRRRRPSPVPS